MTGSTNTDVWQMAEAGAPEWTVMVAGKQEAGRGRLGRTWVSARGESLHVSVLLRPPVRPGEAPLLSLAAAVAMAAACRSVGGVEVGCKWPNDLVAGRTERKLGGILCEASVEEGRLGFVVIGAGVNLTQRRRDFPRELRATATSVAREGGAGDGPGLLRAYLVGLRALYEMGGRGLAGSVLPPYRAACVTIGRTVRATTTAGEEVEGRAVAVADDGSLVVDTGERSAPVAFGEVEHLRQ